MSIARFPAAPRMIVCALILFACALVASTYSVFGYTWDEPEHLAAGVALLDTGEYPYDQQHPPLARVAMALGPVLAGAHSHGNAGPSGEQEGRDILYDGHYDLYLTLARVGMLPFLIVLLIATWLWARRLFDTATALVATAFVATTPVILGHAGVATLDIPMVGMSMLALYRLFKWLDVQSMRNAIVFGVTAGLAAGTKLSAIPFIGTVAVVWFAAWTLESFYRRDGSNPPHSPSFATLSLHAGLSIAAAGVALLACYGFIADHVAASLDALLDHNNAGHLSYFMGELRRTGWWNFYLVGIAVKTPLPLLILGLAGSAWLLTRALRERSWSLAAPASAWIAILIFASAYSHINIGVRHVLLIMPLLALNAAALVVALWQRCRLTVRSVLIALVAWQTWSLSAAHPDYLAYFNELAGNHPERILIDSDLDWGQDIHRLKQTLRDRNIEHVSIIYRGTADLAREGFPSFEYVWPHQKKTGWIAVSLLAKATGSEDGGYDWLNAYQPLMRVGKSIDLYYIEK